MASLVFSLKLSSPFSMASLGRSTGGWVGGASGLVESRCDVLSVLHSTTEEEGSPIQVGFVTYDKSLHFYNIKVREGGREGKGGRKERRTEGRREGGRKEGLREGGREEGWREVWWVGGREKLLAGVKVH